MAKDKKQPDSNNAPTEQTNAAVGTGPVEQTGVDTNSSSLSSIKNTAAGATENTTEQTTAGLQDKQPPTDEKVNTALIPVEQQQQQQQSTNAPSVDTSVQLNETVQQSETEENAVVSVKDVAVPADIAEEADPEFAEFLEYFNANSSDSTKAWARNVINTSVTYKRTRPIDFKGCLNCTMFALNSMKQSALAADETQPRMRFILACFKYVKSVFDIELLGRGANQLTESQYKKYMAMVNLYHYWSDLGTGEEIAKRFNANKELTNAFDPGFAQRVCSVVGI